MSSPITSNDFENQTPGQPLCDAFQEKLLNNDKMRSLLDYLFQADNGKFATGFIGDLIAVLAPIGSLQYFPKTIDAGIANPNDGAVWLEANNQRVLQADYPKLFAVYGTAYNQAGDNAATEFRVPDLQGKFVLGRSSGHAYGTTGGEETHVLTPDENAPHSHYIANGDTVSDSGVPNLDANKFLVMKSSNGHDNPDYALHGSDTKPTIGPTAVSGGAVSTDDDAQTIPGYTAKYKASPHNNMPPYFTGVVYVLAGYKVNGVMV